MSTDSAPDVFISYSTKNLDVAKGIEERLQDDGITCWLAPRRILSGFWPGQIVRGMRACRLVVLVLSEDSSKSVHVVREIALADESPRKRVVPFRIDDAPLGDDLAYYLQAVQTINAFPGKPTAFFTQLVGNVRHALGQPAPEALNPRKGDPFVWVNIILWVVVMLGLAAWLSTTDSGWIVVAAPVISVLIPFLIHRWVLPEVLQPWFNAEIKRIFTSRRTTHRIAFLVASALVCLVAFGVVPYRFSPVLLVVPDSATERMFDRNLRVRVSRDQKDMANPIVLNPVLPFWIGCSGRRTPSADLLERANKEAGLNYPNGSFDCKVPDRLSRSDEVHVAIEMDGELLPWKAKTVRLSADIMTISTSPQ